MAGRIARSLLGAGAPALGAARYDPQARKAAWTRRGNEYVLGYGLTPSNHVSHAPADRVLVVDEVLATEAPRCGQCPGEGLEATLWVSPLSSN